jgi:MtaA/CmuA family methyltransferase
VTTYSAKKRFELAANMKIPDRIPAVYIYHGASLSVLKKTGFTWRDIYFSPKSASQQILTAHRMWKHDNVCSVLSPTCGIDDLGANVNVPEMAEPFVDYKSPLLKDEDDIKRLAAPNFHRGTMGKTSETARLLRKSLGTDIPIVGGFGGLSTWAFFLRRADNFIRDFAKNPGFQKRYMEYLTEIAIEFCIDQVKAGCDWIVSGEDAFATDLFGPDESWKCNGVYAKKLAKAIHDEGARYIIHCCGDAELALNKMAETGADIISVDRIRLGVAKGILGKKVALMGNVKSTVLLGKRPQDVETECIRAINEGKENGGYFLSCGYIYPIATPPANVIALVKSASKYGKY